MKQETAVEWLAIVLYQKFKLEGNGKELNDLVEQAKEMEKVRMESTWIAALDYAIEKMKGLNTLESKDAFEKFYKTTYGGNK